MDNVHELQSKTVQELHGLLAERREELRKLRFMVSEGQLKDVRGIRKARMGVARVLTEMNARHADVKRISQ
jgi:ribosomal protein L29